MEPGRAVPAGFRADDHRQAIMHRKVARDTPEAQRRTFRRLSLRSLLQYLGRKGRFRSDWKSEDPLHNHLSVYLRTTPCTLQRQGTFEEEMHIRLPCHTDGSVYLQAGACG